MQKTLDISDLLIFISIAVKQTFLNNFKIENKKNVVIYNGISNEFFENVVEKENLNIIYAGRLVKIKGVDIFIKALSKICKENSNICATIVGEGVEKENLEKLAIDLEISNNVKFLGKQSNVKELLEPNGIFVYPSIWEEGFGISVIEAMARGCIPVVSKRGGLKEIIKDQENGYLIDEINYKKLADKILEIINLPEEKINIIRKNAIERAKSFSIDVTIEKLENAYESLLK